MWRHVPTLCDAQRGVQLFLKKRLPSAEATQRAQGLYQRIAPKALAEIAFNPPDCDHRGGVHAIRRGHTVQRGGMLRHQALALGHAFVIDQASQVVPDGGFELRLVVQLFQHRGVGLNTVEQRAPGLRRDASLLRLWLQAAQASCPGGRVRFNGYNLGQAGRAHASKQKRQCTVAQQGAWRRRVWA